MKYEGNEEIEVDETMGGTLEQIGEPDIEKLLNLPQTEHNRFFIARAIFTIREATHKTHFWNTISVKT